MWKNILKIIGFFLVGMVGGIFADQIFWPYFIERPLFYQYRLDQPPIYLTETKEVFIQENTALKNAIEKVEKVIVGVKVKTKTAKILEGSALVLSSDGLIVTLAELVPQGSEVILFWSETDQEQIAANQILKRDVKENLVLIKSKRNNLATSGFFNFEKLKLGERVFLLGTIFEDKTIKKIANEGIIKTFDENFIRTNIFEKNILAGSPLFDIEGNILGLNTIDKEGKVIAIPVNKIKSFSGF